MLVVGSSQRENTNCKTTHHLRFRESLGTVFVDAGVDRVAGFEVEAAGLGIGPSRNSCGGAAADTSAPADLTGVGAGATAAAAVDATIAAGAAPATDSVLPTPLLKLSAVARRDHAHERGIWR